MASDHDMSRASCVTSCPLSLMARRYADAHGQGKRPSSCASEPPASWTARTSQEIKPPLKPRWRSSETASQKRVATPVQSDARWPEPQQATERVEPEGDRHCVRLQPSLVDDIRHQRCCAPAGRSRLDAQGDHFERDVRQGLIECALRCQIDAKAAGHGTVLRHQHQAVGPVLQIGQRQLVGSLRIRMVHALGDAPGPYPHRCAGSARRRRPAYRVAARQCRRPCARQGAVRTRHLSGPCRRAGATVLAGRRKSAGECEILLSLAHAVVLAVFGAFRASEVA